MRLLRLTSVYETYLDAKEAGFPKGSNYAEAFGDFCRDWFSWPDSFTFALRQAGWEARECFINVERLQRLWATEHGMLQGASLDDIALAQVAEFRPDILWFDDHRSGLLKTIKSAHPEIQLILGWVGSALPTSDVLHEVDLVLTCAPESVQTLAARGLMAAHLDHAFDPRILAQLTGNNQPTDLAFVGQLIRRSAFHRDRERILIELVQDVKLHIYTPSWLLKPEVLKTRFKQWLWDGCNGPAKRLPFPIRLLPSSLRARFENAVGEWVERPVEPVHAKLKPHMRPALFGLAMFQALRDAKVTLNIHADSSPLFASNMRLFETSGVGSCLLTDWKSNIGTLFSPDSEVVTWKSTAECVEKARWLLDHPQERSKIAAAGQKKCLSEHTFDKRVPLFIDIVERELKKR